MKYRWFGGIGYLLIFVPYINTVSWVLLGLAWYLFGRSSGQRVFYITGILMFVMFLLQLIGLFMLSPLLLMMPASAPTIMTNPPAVGGLSPALFMPLLGILSIMGIAAILLLIFEVWSHFRAAGLLKSRWFSAAAWLRVLAIIAILVSLPLTVVTVLKGVILMGGIPEQPSIELIFSMFWPLLAALSISIISYILSAIAFFKIKNL